MINIPCVILSGGKSSRMGEDKSFLPFENSTLIEYQYNRLSKIFSKVYISSKTNKFNFNCNIIYDNNQNISSPMIALNSILKSIESNKVFIITVDTPLILEKTINHLIKISQDYNITIASDKNKTHNLCGVFSKNINYFINDCLKKDIHKINYLLKNTDKKKIVYFENENEFINLNTISEYKELIDNSRIK